VAILAENGRPLSVLGQNRLAILAVTGKVMAVNGQNAESKVADDGHGSLAVLHKKGVPVYERNPSVPERGAIAKQRRAQIGDDRKGLVIDGSGEVLGPGCAVAYEWEEVDAERFVKLFLAGLKQAAGLSKSGLAIFEVIYQQMRQNPGRDQVHLSFYAAAQTIPDLAERTYRRGVRELLDREFLFRSTFDGVFFVNIRFMFNGDRLAFVKAYQLKKEKDAPPQQLSLLPDA
jgi:hypothetical protein